MNSFDSRKELQKIIQRYVSGKATAEEILFVEEYYKHLGQNENELNLTEIISSEALNFIAIKAKINSSKKPKILSIYKYAAAAAVFLFIAGTAFFVSKSGKFFDDVKPVQVQNLDILPGTNKATLTLADGSRIILDEKTAANISNRNGLKITKTNNGQLIYTILDNENFKNKTISYNTIKTPKGGQYQVILPDGTKVWLNAASSLKYPEVFVGNMRNVELTGEAYFEVTKNNLKPFHVKSHGQDVAVLGTHFNINTYMDDQTIRTTLLKGSVSVSNLNSTLILKPGEQSISGINEFSKIKLATDVDIEDETAWKNGLFQFNNAGLKSILNQIERWYDIKIDYNSIPNKRYNGMVPRNAKLSEVLKMLELTGNIKFEILEGRNLKVSQGKQ
ncbi:FecR family protein [Pedobacter mucosus]|uniref:FecR family protein n=1 Tax=Pedobacter mucosus TaxID=2895286 RepID=UPI001EE40432|nr:FecR family protein [Pedobacter mucosus]UKT62656.1 FecR family protein [Pedobacter mucosus]